MPLIDYEHPARTLLVGALAAAMFATLFILGGTTTTGPRAAMMYIAGGGIALIALYFVFGAWYYVTGRASARDIDPSARRALVTHRILRQMYDVVRGRRPL
ncbi:MAG: hypothetical protein ACJ735_02560 [Actinomycetes bacterium]